MSIERMPGAGASFIAACGSCGHAAGTHRADARGACRAVTMSVPGPDAFRMLCGCSRYGSCTGRRTNTLTRSNGGCRSFTCVNSINGVPQFLSTQIVHLTGLCAGNKTLSSLRHALTNAVHQSDFGHIALRLFRKRVVVKLAAILRQMFTQVARAPVIRSSCLVV